MSRLRVAMFTHAFHDPENRKHIVALAEQVHLCVLTPARLERYHLEFQVNDIRISQVGKQYFQPLRRLALHPARVSGHYALGSLSFGFHRNPPDIIHIDHDPWSPVFWQALASQRAFAPSARILISPKKNTYRRYRGILGDFKERVAHAGLRRVDLALAASRMTATLYRDFFGFPEERIRVVTHLPVDVHTFKPGELPPHRGGPPVVGFSGRFHPQKGVLDLVEAVDRCHAAGQSIRLRLLGSGALREDLKRMSLQRDWLEVLDPVPLAEVASFMNGLDIFAAPTRIEPDHQEHDGHALLQAMAMRLPCVGCRSGIISEIIEPETGVLVEPENPAKLADVLIELANDPRRRAILAQQARITAEERYSIKAVTSAKVEAYESICGPHDER